MKLVEILARELKKWPKGFLWAVQDCYSKHERTVWFGAGERPVFERGDWTVSCNLKPLEAKNLASDYATAIVTRADWQAAVDALNKPAGPAWDGEGRPPVGTRCEWLDSSSSQRWLTVDIAFPSCWVIVVRDVNPHPDGPVDLAININNEVAHFRPIRTPEQIADTERQQAIQQMLNVVSDEVSRQVLAELYDAGYRKQPTE